MGIEIKEYLHWQFLKSLLHRFWSIIVDKLQLLWKQDRKVNHFQHWPSGSPWGLTGLKLASRWFDVSRFARNTSTALKILPSPNSLYKTQWTRTNGSQFTSRWTLNTVVNIFHIFFLHLTQNIFPKDNNTATRSASITIQWKFNFTPAMSDKCHTNLMSVALVHTPLRAGKGRHDKWADHRWAPTCFRIFRKMCLLPTKLWSAHVFLLKCLLLLVLLKRGNVKICYWYSFRSLSQNLV